MITFVKFYIKRDREIIKSFCRLCLSLSFDLSSKVMFQRRTRWWVRVTGFCGSIRHFARSLSSPKPHPATSTRLRDHHHHHLQHLIQYKFHAPYTRSPHRSTRPGQRRPPTSLLLPHSLLSGLMDDNNWDLFAVVRGCSAGTVTAASDPFSSFLVEDSEGEKDRRFVFPDTMDTSSCSCAPQELCNPSSHELGTLPQLSPLLSPTAALLPAAAYPRHSPQRAPSQTPRSKRR